MPKDLLRVEKNSLPADSFWRMIVLADTVVRLETAEQRKMAHEQAKKNHETWKQNAQNKSSNIPQVSVVQGDWGEVAAQRSRETGEVYAVLNMANAYSPGGGYLEGMIAQEENMFRRTDCHFHVKNEQMDSNREYYTPEMSQLINAEGVNDNKGKVYLDVKNPRVCIKGKENRENNKLSGYDCLPTEEYFEFYELKSAADDLRDLNEDGKDKPFNSERMRKKIAAQLDTLHEAKIRHVILSAFGCGAFKNPASEVAQIYKEELIKRPGFFDDVTFAVYFAGYGPSNFTPFNTVLKGLTLGVRQKNEKNREPEQQCHSVENLRAKSRSLDEVSLLQTSNAEPVREPKSSSKPSQENNSNEIIKTLVQNINSSKWDNKGFVLPFFNFRKVPNGIVELRKAIKNPAKNPVELLEELKKIAQSRLDHYPLFTKRDKEVAAFYYEITQITAEKVNSLSIKQT